MDDFPVYLDHNATTPIAPEVLEVFVDTAQKYFGNPSSFDHMAGYEASQIVLKARKQIGELIVCDAKEIYFTSGSTEANNIAILGLAETLETMGKDELITTSIEHPAVLACFQELERRGFKVSYVRPDETGSITSTQINEILTERTGLVSVMAANNETGMCQPIKEIASICDSSNVLFHCDFSQALSLQKIDLSNTPIDLMSISSHKAYGPMGVGALFIRAKRPRIKLRPLFFGGGQEREMRPGTLNTPGIAAFGRCAELIKLRQKSDVKKQQSLRITLASSLLEITGAVLNTDLENSLPNTFSMAIQGINPRALMHSMRDKVIFSASSACATDKVEPSHVLTSTFGSIPRVRESFRIGMGRSTTEEQIQAVSILFKKHVEKLRGDFI